MFDNAAPTPLLKTDFSHIPLWKYNFLRRHDELLIDGRDFSNFYDSGTVSIISAVEYAINYFQKHKMQARIYFLLPMEYTNLLSNCVNSIFVDEKYFHIINDHHDFNKSDFSHRIILHDFLQKNGLYENKKTLSCNAILCADTRDFLKKILAESGGDAARKKLYVMAAPDPLTANIDIKNDDNAPYIYQFFEKDIGKESLKNDLTNIVSDIYDFTILCGLMDEVVVKGASPLITSLIEDCLKIANDNSVYEYPAPPIIKKQADTAGDYDKAVLLFQRGQVHDALDIFKKNIMCNDGDILSMRMAGLLLASSGDYEGAIEPLKKSLSVRWCDVEIAHALAISYAGLCLKDAQKINDNSLQKASYFFTVMIDIQADYDEGLKNFLNFIRKLNNHDMMGKEKLLPYMNHAIFLLCEALTQNDKIKDIKCIYHFLACYYSDIHEFWQAGYYLRLLDSYVTTIKDAPPAPFNTEELQLYSFIASNANLNDLADKYYQLHLTLAPQDANLHWNYAQHLLGVGEYKNAWPHYEYRWQIEQFKASHRHFNIPRWQGERLDGKTLFIAPEQGLGEQIIFAAIANDIKNSRGGNHVLFAVDKRLKEMLQAGLKNVTFIAKNDLDETAFITDNKIDYYIEMMSLGHVLNLPSLPVIASPILIPDDKRVKYYREKWRKKYPKHVFIGLAWESKAPQWTSKLRTINTADLLPLFKLKQYKFFNLQYARTHDDVRADFARHGMQIECEDEIENFYDLNELVAFMQAMDLIIATGTSTGHLACASGAKTWICLIKQSYWLWNLNGIYSKIYPQSKLLKQFVERDWASLMKVLMRLLANNLH